eukprot:CAMPEP_0197892244 /NCGR_PEP_ID=MMETSP1439-20131203/30041_1 /TAXON_ID=66791 /ORGANISM="Gonyaulax spinifera, Strain CCMP409" /LENGTH=155 /DNA_ID=CAMNT_0043512399 /DNA_START=394 /DNA_END=861 /DNA_ORIENTATION=-
MPQVHKLIRHAPVRRLNDGLRGPPQERAVDRCPILLSAVGMLPVEQPELQLHEGRLLRLNSLKGQGSVAVGEADDNVGCHGAHDGVAIVLVPPRLLCVRCLSPRPPGHNIQPCALHATFAQPWVDPPSQQLEEASEPHPQALHKAHRLDGGLRTL